MKLLDLTFPSPEENLACDDALLEAAEEGLCGEFLRFWLPRDYFVVLGYSNKISQEVNLPACQKNRIPVLRRISGGGTVLQGPGCLNYSLILEIRGHTGLSGIRATNEFVMKKNCEVFRRLKGPEVSIRGVTDLALGNLKFSGNAQRRKSQYVLFHGTFLLNFDIPRLEKFLANPPLQPDYRENRKHSEFVVNLNLKPEEIKKNLIAEWDASENIEFKTDKIKKLIENHYSKKEWNFKF